MNTAPTDAKTYAGKESWLGVRKSQNKKESSVWGLPWTDLQIVGGKTVHSFYKIVAVRKMASLPLSFYAADRNAAELIEQPY